jgi:Fibronectin type III domain
LKTLRLLKQVLIVAGAALLVSACNDQGAAPLSNAASSGARNASSTATLSWEAPTANTNGSALTDLAGYRIYYGTSPTQMNDSVQIKTTGVQTYVIDNLAAGTWYFAIMAVTSAGTESGLSNVVSLTIG